MVSETETETEAETKTETQAKTEPGEVQTDSDSDSESQPDTDQESDSLANIKSRVRSSDTRQEILRELYIAPDEYGTKELRPSKLQQKVCPRTNTSKGNLFAALRMLHELNLIARIDGEGRAVLYKLTARGEEIAEEEGLVIPLANTDSDPDPDADESNTSQQRTQQQPQPQFQTQNSGAQDTFKFTSPSSTSTSVSSVTASEDSSDTSNSVDADSTSESSQSQPEPPFDKPPSLVNFTHGSSPEDQRVEQIATQLTQYLLQTNVSLPELVAAVERLTESMTTQEQELPNKIDVFDFKMGHDSGSDSTSDSSR
jgi:hypothetical protein